MSIELTDEEKAELISALRVQLFKGKANLGDSDEYYLGLIKKLRIEIVYGAVGTEITKRGKLGRKLYIVREGAVNVLDDDDISVKLTLRRGESHCLVCELFKKVYR